MSDEFPIVTICGSMRFYDDILTAAQMLSTEGYIVLAPYVTFTGEGQHSEGKAMLDRMHFAKIDLSAWIYVVNIDGYIGDSTRREIEHATKNGKNIVYQVRPE